MIRQFQISDTEQVMRIWLNGNEDAHPFISKEYWRSHFAQVQEQLSQAEVSAYETDGKIQGFIGIQDEYIAGIFVDRICRSCGIGKQLLEYAKQTHHTLTLGVYQKNKRAAALYFREGFSILSEKLDKSTGEMEYTMIWKDGTSQIQSIQKKILFLTKKHSRNDGKNDDFTREQNGL